MLDAETIARLKEQDAQDPLNWTRAEFEIPNTKACGGDRNGESIYFCGNSLGPLNKKARQHILEELEVWSTSSVTGHFSHPYNRPWKHVDAPLTPLLAEIVGAKESEVAHSGTLTSNLHNLFVSFYRPSKERWKIVIEKGSFPSDWYAIHSHPKIHEDILSPEQISNAVIALEPRQGEDTLRTEDIVAVLEENKDTISVVWLPLVQYYTGQYFDIPPLAKKSHEIGALIGLDMAHGIGNVECKLNEWDVDFAVWCTYKYLNAGPAAMGGYYIKTGLDDGGRRLAGWWGNDSATRFQMEPTFRPTPGAKGYQHSCTPVFSSIPLLATLELMTKIGFPTLREKAIRLTNTLEALLQKSRFYIPPVKAGNTRDHSTVGFRIITPAAPWRGTQLSLFIEGPPGVMPRVFSRCLKEGLVGDERHPNVIRLSPVALYVTFEDVGKCVEILHNALEAEEGEKGSEKVEERNIDMLDKDTKQI